MNGDGDIVGLFVKTLGGGHAHRITPDGMPPLSDSRGSWSPHGDKIVFTTQTAPNRQPSLWIVRANGRGLHRIHIHPDPSHPGHPTATASSLFAPIRTAASISTPSASADAA